MLMPGGGTEKSMVSKIFLEYSRLSAVRTAIPEGVGAEPLSDGRPEPDIIGGGGLLIGWPSVGIVPPLCDLSR